MYKPVSMRRTATALVAGVAVFFSGLVATPAYAQNATDNANITITELTVSNDAQNGADETLTVWDNATFNAKWKAENGVKNGEKFTVKYPAEFQVYASQDFKLVDKNGTDGGDCKVVSDEQTIECTFNKEFEGRDNVEGTLTTKLQAKQTRDSRDVELEVNHKQTSTGAKLPGKGVGIGESHNRLPKDITKFGWYTIQGNEGYWVINMPGKDLAESNKDTIHVEDELTGYGHQYKNCKVDFNEYAATDSGNDYSIDKQIADHDDLVKNLNCSGTKISFDLKRPDGGWKTDSYYRASYKSQTADGNIAPAGEKTTNKAKVLGKEVTSTIQRDQYSSGTIQGVKRQSFEVKKNLTDQSPTSKVPTDTKFTIQAAYKANGKDETEKIEVGLDGTPVSGKKELPVGTEVTLSEIEMPNVDGVTWGEPKFTATDNGDAGNVTVAPDGKSAVVKIKDGGNVGVTVTNTISSVTPPPPTNGGGNGGGTGGGNSKGKSDSGSLKDSGSSGGLLGALLGGSSLLSGSSSDKSGENGSANGSSGGAAASQSGGAAASQSAGAGASGGAAASKSKDSSVAGSLGGADKSKENGSLGGALGGSDKSKSSESGSLATGSVSSLLNGSSNSGLGKWAFLLLLVPVLAGGLALLLGAIPGMASPFQALQQRPKDSNTQNKGPNKDNNTKGQGPKQDSDTKGKTPNDKALDQGGPNQGKNLGEK